MIVVDTSALMAVLLGEPEADACAALLAAAPVLLMSAGTMAEALIVAQRRGIGDDMERLIDDLGFEIVPLTPDSARRVSQAYGRWGKGAHVARLNMGDCFACELATSRDLPLLYIGNDFARTDLMPALPR